MEDKLNIQQLADLLAHKHGMEQQDAEVFVREYFALIEEGLERDKYVKIKGLGTFKLIVVESRESINVNTGERFEIQSHSKISFTPDLNLKEIINRPFSHFETVVLSAGVQVATVADEGPESDALTDVTATATTENTTEPAEETAQVEVPMQAEVPVLTENPAIAEVQPTTETQPVAGETSSNEAEAPETGQTLVDALSQGEVPVPVVAPPLPEETSAPTEDAPQETPQADDEMPTEVTDEPSVAIESAEVQADGTDGTDAELKPQDVQETAGIAHVQEEDEAQEPEQTRENQASGGSAQAEESAREQKSSAPASKPHKSFSRTNLLVAAAWIIVVLCICVNLYMYFPSLFDRIGELFIPHEEVTTEQSAANVQHNAVNGLDQASTSSQAENEDSAEHAPDEPASASSATASATSAGISSSGVQPAKSSSGGSSTSAPATTPVGSPSEPSSSTSASTSSTSASTSSASASIPSIANTSAQTTPSTPTVQPHAGPSDTAINPPAVANASPNDYRIVGTETTYTIQDGETLSMIAQRYYGSKSLYPLIVSHNADIITDPDIVPPGITIRIPKLEKK